MAKKDIMSRKDEILNYLRLGATRDQLLDFLEITTMTFTAIIEKLSEERYGRKMHYEEFLQKIAFEERMNYKASLISFAHKTQSPDFRWKIWNDFFNEPEKQTEEQAKVVIQDLSKMRGGDVIAIGRAISEGVDKKINKAVAGDEDLK